MPETAVQPVAAAEPSSCGTYGAAQRHRRRGEPLDQACKDARRDYMRDFRSRTGPGNDRWWVRTYNTALRDLAAEYPERFAELLAEVRESEPTPWDPGDPS